jgi:RNA 3'-terminal phosphate cyclase (ATP)
VKKKPLTESQHVIVVLETDTGSVLSADYLADKATKPPVDIVESIVSTLYTNFSAGCCVDEHTADQLIVYMALAQGKSCIHCPRQSECHSLHLLTAIDLAAKLTGATFEV